MIIIGITGTLSAGKGTIVDYLKGKGFRHFSARGFLTEELKQRGLPATRDNLVALGNELRAQNSPSYIAEKLYEEAAKTGENCIIESIRTVGEINALRNKGQFYLFAVDADPLSRYERAMLRNSATDRISSVQFFADEGREMRSANPNKQNLSACIKEADYRFENNGTIEELNKKISSALEHLALEHKIIRQ